MSRVKIPKNVLVLATHGSATLPSCAQKNLHPNFSKRLQRNFSDFGTTYLLKNFPKQQTARPKFGRIVGDTNRSHSDSDLFREADFNNVRIWQRPLSSKQKRKYLRQSRQAYLDAVFSKIETLCQAIPAQEPIVILDLHDTGNRLLGTSPESDVVRSKFVMPKAIFSNQNNKTSNAMFLQKSLKHFKELFNSEKNEVAANEVFHGGFITKFFGGVEENPKLAQLLKKYNRCPKSLMVVQCELNRDLYLDESTQKIRPEVGRIRKRFEAFVSKIAGA